MKTLNLLFALIFVNMFALKATAQSRKNNTHFIQISATAIYNNLPTYNYAIILYKDGIKVDSVFNKGVNSIDFIFQLNQVYTLIVKKDGCENKMIVVNTYMPEGLQSISNRSKAFNIDMSAITINKSNENEDFPSEVLIIDKTQYMLIVSKSYQEFKNQNIQSNGFFNATVKN